MAKHSDPDQYSAKETQKRMDDAVRRAMNTPPKPHAEMIKKPVGSKGRGKISRLRSPYG